MIAFERALVAKDGSPARSWSHRWVCGACNDSGPWRPLLLDAQREAAKHIAAHYVPSGGRS